MCNWFSVSALTESVSLKQFQQGHQQLLEQIQARDVEAATSTIEDHLTGLMDGFIRGVRPGIGGGMDEQITYLETGSQDPFFNLAFEEALLTHRREGSCLLLWQNDKTVVIGQNQNAEEEINRAFVEAHGIRVVRRTTGGGAVYHDLGNLNYSFITDAGAAETLTMTRFTLPVVQALRGLGLRAESGGRNDILVEGRKVSGTAQRLLNGRILHHGTLLFDTDPAMAEGALRVDPEKFRSKGAKSVRSRIGNIREFLQEDMDLTAFWAYLKATLAGGGFCTGTLSQAELREAERLKEMKYSTWDWTFGRSPAYDLTNRRRWDGGSLEVRLSVRKGRITEIAFFGDFLSRCPLDPLRSALAGTAFRWEDAARVLAQYPLADYFGGISAWEILETMFHVHE